MSAGDLTRQLFQVANWPRLPDDLSATEHPEVAQFAAQAREWMRQLSLILDHTLLAGGAKAAESSDALKNYPYPAGAVIYADGEGGLAGDATNLFWDATNKRLGIRTAAPGGPLHVYTSAGEPDTIGGSIILNRYRLADSWRGAAVFSYFKSTIGSDVLAFAVSGNTTPLDIAKVQMTLAATGDLAIVGNLLPGSASGKDLGSTVLEWANAYIGTGRAWFGAGQNASVYWNGTGLVLGVGGEAALRVTISGGKTLVTKP